jgi:hypothetical protein
MYLGLYASRDIAEAPMTFERDRKSNDIKRIRKIYDTVHLALWSAGAALVIFFCVFTLPGMLQLRAEVAAKRIQTIAAENRYFCRWYT